MLGRGRGAHRGADALGVQRQHARVHAVGLATHAERAGEVPHPVGAGDGDGEAGGVQGVHERPLEPPGRVGDDERRHQAGESGHEPADAGGGVGRLERRALRADVHVEGGLRHVDPHEAVGHPVLRWTAVVRGGARPCRCGLARCTSGGPGDCPSLARGVGGGGDLVPR